MTATTTLAHAALNLPSSLRTSGHATPNHGSRSNTPVRVKRVLQAQTDHMTLKDSDAGNEGRVRRSSSAHALDTTSAPSVSNGRRRRLSVTTFGEGESSTPQDANQTIIDDVLTRRQQGGPPVAQLRSVGVSASTSVLKMQMPLSDYAVLGPDATVVQAASQVVDPAVRCVVVATPGAAYILARQEVERLARYSHEPFTDTLGSFMTGSQPSASVYPGASVGTAAGLLLKCSDTDFLPVVEDGSGSFLGLLSRTDLVQVLLGDGRHVHDASVGCGEASTAPALSAAPSAPAGSGTGAGGYGEADHASCHVGAHHQHRLAQGSEASAFAPCSGSRPPLHQHAMMQRVAAAAAAAATAATAGRMAGGGAVAAAAAASLGEDISPHALLLASSEQRASAGGSEQQQQAPELHNRPNSRSEQQHNHHNLLSSTDAMENTTAADGLRSVADPIKSGWDMLDNANDVMDVLGMVGRTVNAEAVGRRLLGDMLGGAANVAGGSSGTGWLFKYLYDSDCSICRTFQAMIEKLDDGVGRVAFVDIASQGFNPIEHGGINYLAAMETVHILSANGQVFKGVTAVIKLMAAVDADWATNMATVTAVLPLLSLSYMLVSKNRHHLSKVWEYVLRTTKVDRALFGRDILGPAGMGGSMLGGRDGGSRREDEASSRDHKLQPQPSM